MFLFLFKNFAGDERYIISNFFLGLEEGENEGFSILMKLNPDDPFIIQSKLLVFQCISVTL